MLVTCPECVNRISAEADPCPSCGLAEAGQRSLEYCHMVAEWINARRGQAAVMDKYPGNEAHGTCGREGDVLVKVKKAEVVSRDTEYPSAGYLVRTTAECTVCGGELWQWGRPGGLR